MQDAEEGFVFKMVHPDPARAGWFIINDILKNSFGTTAKERNLVRIETEFRMLDIEDLFIINLTADQMTMLRLLMPSITDIVRVEDIPDDEPLPGIHENHEYSKQLLKRISQGFDFNELY